MKTKIAAVLTFVLAIGALAVAPSMPAHASLSTAQTHNLKQHIPNANSAIDSISVSTEGVIGFDIADLSAEATYYVVAPHAGTIKTIYSVIDGVVSTADATVTCRIGSTGITNGVLTIATAASAAGDVDVATPTAANTITAGAAINCVVTGAGAGGSPRAHVAIVISR